MRALKLCLDVGSVHQVPSDASIALSVLEDEQLALMRVAVSRPSLIQDLQQDMMHKGADQHLLI